MPQHSLHQVEEEVIHIIAQLCKREVTEIAKYQSLANDLAVDSIQFLELLSTLEEHFGFEMEVDDLQPERFRSVQSVIHFVLGKTGE